MRTPIRITRTIASLGAAALTAAALVVAPASPAQASHLAPFRLEKAVAVGASSTLTAVDRSLGIVGAYGSSGKWSLVDLDSLSVVGTRSAISGSSAVTVDEIHHRIFQGGGAAPFGTDVPVIGTVSVGSDAPSKTFSLPSQYADEAVVALTYDASHDRIYALTADAAAAIPALGEGALVTLHALDAKVVADGGGVAGDGAAAVTQHPGLLWSYSLDGCSNVPTSKVGGFLGLTPEGEVYFFCTALQVPVVENVSMPSGIVVADLAGLKVGTNSITGARQADGVQLEYFPLPGTMTNGFVAGAGDTRVMIGNASAGVQKLFVFDVEHRSWSGAIPLGAGNITGGAADPATGRGYVLQQPIGSSATNVIATQVSALPVPQGVAGELRDANGVPVDSASAPVNVDVDGQRLIVPVGSSLLFFDDLLPIELPTEPDDPDRRTADVDEGDGVSVAYSGEGTAFGARVTEVNGYNSTPVGDTLRIQQLRDLPRPAEGDRGSILGWVELARLAGNESGSTDASADARRLAFDPSTSSDLDANAPPPDEMQAQMSPSSCSSARDEPQTAEHPGSGVSCDIENGAVVATASTSGDELAASPLQVGAAESNVRVIRDPKKGIVVTSTAVSRDVTIAIPNAGAIIIGEARAVATAAAKGRPGSASSELEPTLSQVRIIGPDGETAYACDTCDPIAVADAVNRYLPPRVRAFPPRPDPDEKVSGSPGGARAVVIEDPYAYVSDKNTNNDDFASVSALQLVVFHDSKGASREYIQLASVLAGTLYTVTPPADAGEQDPASLTLELTNEAGEPLAGGVFGIRADAGALPVDDAVDDATDATDTTTPADGPSSSTTTTTTASTTTTTRAGYGPQASGTTSTTSKATSTSSTTAPDDSDITDTTETTDTTIPDTSETTAGDELDDALVPDGACVTTDDGTGDCTFEDLAPGSYVVTETAAPPGYAVSDDIPVTLAPGMATTIEVTNVRSAATIEISLTDDHDPPAPLPGGEFAVAADDGDGLLGAADVELGRCTTGDDGRCAPIEDVPLGSYVVHQTATPDGLAPADDVAFTLDLPGQTAALVFVNGAASAAGAPADVGTPASTATTGGATHSYGSVAIAPPPPAPAPVITSTPIAPPSSPLQRVLDAPSEMASFLARNPAEGALFAGVWGLLLAPAYLLVRRRKLTLVKELL